MPQQPLGVCPLVRHPQRQHCAVAGHLALVRKELRFTFAERIEEVLAVAIPAK